MIDIAEVKYLASYFEVVEGTKSKNEVVVEVDFVDVDNQIDLLDMLSGILPEGGAYLEATPRHDSKYMYLVRSVDLNKKPIASYVVSLKPFLEYMGAKFELTPLVL